jgi:hypothetical protein
MKRSLSALLPALIGLATLALTTRTYAQVTLYTDRGSFIAATNSSTNIDFEGLVPSGSYVFYNTPIGLTISGVKFVGNDGFGFNELVVVDAAYYPPYYNWGSGAVLRGPRDLNPGAQIAVTLPAGITAVGSDIMSFRPYADSVKVTLSTGNMFTLPTDSYSNRAFVGFISTTPIKSLTFQSTGGSYINLDNFVFGHGSSVPEPGACALFTGLGLTCAAFLCRKRARKTA